MEKLISSSVPQVKPSGQTGGRPWDESRRWGKTKHGQNSSAMRTLAGDLMYELDALYASTEMIRSGRFSEFPLDGLLLFRVWSRTRPAER
jgi:hypothetical protein